MTTKRERARPLSPTERRTAIVEAARPLFLQHGTAATTRQVAEAAGIAEGTVFRAFATKEELVDAVLDREFDPEPLLVELREVDREQPLRERLVEATGLLQRRFLGIFTMMAALALPRPPERLAAGEARHHLAHDALVALVAPDAHRFRVPPEEVVRLLRLLTFSGSHPHLSDQQPMTAAQIVGVILDGTLVPDCACAGSAR